MSLSKKKVIIITLISITVIFAVVLGFKSLLGYWMHEIAVENNKEKKRIEEMGKVIEQQQALTEKLMGQLNDEDKEKIEILNTYENAMERYSNYAIHMNYFYDSLLKIKDKKNSFKEVKNMDEMKKEIVSCDKLNTYLKENIMEVSQELGCSKKGAEELNYAILNKNWSKFENILFINLIRKDNNYKKFCEELYCNAIKINMNLNESAKVKFHFYNKEEDKILKEKTKVYTDEFWQSNSGEDLSTKEHIEKTKEILKLAKKSNDDLNDVYKHMINQIQLEISNIEIKV